MIKIIIIRSNMIRKRQLRVVSVAMLIMIVFYVIEITHLLPITRKFDITVVGYTLGSIVFLIAILKYKLLDSADVARQFALDELASCSFIAFDSDENVIYYNKPSKKLFPMIDKDKDTVINILEEHIELKEPIEIDNRMYVTRREMLGEEADNLGRIYLINDETDHFQYMEDLRIQKEIADDANKAKSSFLANMSHEIRTPINTIMGMNEMIMREDATGVPKGYFLSMMNYALDIRNASESLLGLINDLLDISKIESGKMHLVEQEYDVQDMMRSIVSMIRVRSTEKELTFDVIIDEILPRRMYGDAGKIKQIVLNLLTNAVKYTDVGGFILSVSMEERSGELACLRFSVKDTGMGIKKEDMEKLFTAYERLDEQKNSSIQGTGLGLDISRKFAEMMAGKLWCESVYGEGSEFIFTVTQRIVDSTPIGVFVEHDEGAVKGPYVPQFIAPDADILVVDDNPMNLSVIKGLLKATRVFVTTSTSGEDALDKIRDSKFNVVFLDHMMPGMDGIETVEKIREFDKELPVYVLTANATAGEEYYKSKGFNGYLSKPIDSEVLEKTIMRHLPEKMMEKPTREAVPADLTELPDNLLWLNETEGISVPEGIKNSGGISNFIFSLILLDIDIISAEEFSES